MLVGCDFSSSPSKRKPIVIALGSAKQARVHLQELLRFETLDAWSQWLAQPMDWVGGFDLPFGLPRELVETLNWPAEWPACMQHYASLSREEIREQFKAFCDARPVGQKFAHRQTDGPAGSSPSMKWVNPQWLSCCMRGFLDWLQLGWRCLECMYRRPPLVFNVLV